MQGVLRPQQAHVRVETVTMSKDGGSVKPNKHMQIHTKPNQCTLIQNEFMFQVYMAAGSWGGLLSPTAAGCLCSMGAG
jgi:hypothetical protein